eukprot:8115861-Prorocentrum_lima.AAC.1
MPLRTEIDVCRSGAMSPQKRTHTSTIDCLPRAFGPAGLCNFAVGVARALGSTCVAVKSFGG